MVTKLHITQVIPLHIMPIIQRRLPLQLYKVCNKGPSTPLLNTTHQIHQCKLAAYSAI